MHESIIESDFVAETSILFSMLIFSFAILTLCLIPTSFAAAADEINCQFEAYQTNPKTPKEKYKKGYCYIKLNRFREGAAELSGLQKTLPEIADYVTYYEGVGNRWSGNLSKAATLFNKVLTDYPGESAIMERTLNQLAEIHLMNNDFSNAEKVLRLLYNERDEDSDKATALYQVGEALEGQGKYNEAINIYKQVWVEFPETDTAGRAFARISEIGTSREVTFAVMQSEYLKRAERLYENRKWKDAMNDFLKVPQTNNIRTKTAVSMYHLGRLNEASQILSEISSPESLYWRGMINTKRGLDAQASETYSQIHLFYPQSELAPTGLYKAARLYEVNKNNLKAMELYNTLIKKYPNSEEAEDGAWYFGWIYYKRKMYDHALATFSAYTDANSSFNASNAKYWKARTLEKLGRRQEALAVYNELARSQVPTYHSYMAQKKIGYTPKLTSFAPELSSNGTSTNSRRHKAQLLLDMGIFDDAVLEIEKMKARANTKEELVDVSLLYAKANDFNKSIKIAQDLNIPSANTLSFPRGFSEVVKPFAAKYGVDEFLVYSIIREESRFQEGVASSANAIGLMQLIPSTATSVARQVGIDGFNIGMLSVPRINVELGIYYFKEVLDRFGGQVHLALGSYNAGPGRVDNWLVSLTGLETDEFIEEIPFRETRNYIRRILRSYGAYKAIYGDGQAHIRTN